MALYEVVETEQLPRFDSNRLIKHVLLSPAMVDRLNRWIHSSKAVLSTSYFLGNLLFPVVMFAPAQIGEYAALVESCMELPVALLVAVSLRVDLVKLLVGAYDFWFFSVAAVAFTVPFSLLVHDLRMVLVIVRCLGFHVPIFIDANVQSHAKSLVIGVMINVVLILIALAAVSFELLPDVAVESDKNKIISGATGNGTGEPSRRIATISLRDLLVNAMATMEILLLRIVVRKFELLRQKRSAATREVAAEPRKSSATLIIQCVTLRCSVKLRPIATSTTDSTTTTTAVTAVAAAVPTEEGVPHPQDNSTVNTGSSRYVQLRRADNRVRYDSTSIIAPVLLQCNLKPWYFVGLHSVGAIGLLLTVVCWQLRSSSSSALSSLSLVARVVSVGALACTGSYLCIVVLFYNRQLLLHVVLSFDFVFLSLQLTMAHVCVADMLQYQLTPSVALVCAWLWIHCVLTRDALTPDVQQRLCICIKNHRRVRSSVLVVLLLYLAGQCAVLIQGLWWNQWQLRDRVFLSVYLLGYHLQLRVLPFFASRMMTVSVWTLRLLWRVAWQHDPHTLIMVRGHVEYEWKHGSHMNQSSYRNLASIVPATPGPPAAPRVSSLLVAVRPREPTA